MPTKVTHMPAGTMPKDIEDKITEVGKILEGSTIDTALSVLTTTLKYTIDSEQNPELREGIANIMIDLSYSWLDEIHENIVTTKH